MTKILIFSDNHGSTYLMRDIIKKEKANYVFHAGDFCISEEEIDTIIDYYVAGNNDRFGETTRKIKIEGVNIYLTHGHKVWALSHEKRVKKLAALAEENDCQVIITGHTHVSETVEIDGKLLINPGSAKYPRTANRMPSYATLIINKKELKAKIHYVDDHDKLKVW